MARIIFTYRDYDDEPSTATFPTTDLTALNIDGEYADALTLQTALGAVLLGNLVRREHVAKTSPLGVGRASSQHAQRESKALVKYYDDTTFERATMELPCPDLTLQNPDYPGVFYLDGAANNAAVWETFVTQFEALVTAPGGNTPIVESIVHVGRRL